MGRAGNMDGSCKGRKIKIGKDGGKIKKERTQMDERNWLMSKFY